MIEAFQEQLITIDELRARMPALRARETSLRGQLAALDAQLADRDAYLKLADDLEGFLAQLRDNAGTATVPERQRVLRLLVKDVLIGPEKITIRHRIPARGNGATSRQPGTGPDTEGDQRASYPLRWGRGLAVIANLFLHYAFDAWMAREFPGSGSSGTAMTRWCTAPASTRPATCGTRSLGAWRRWAWNCIRIRPGSSTARTTDRRGDHEVTSFTFLGYEFRHRLAKNRHGKHFVSFLPAVSTRGDEGHGQGDPLLALGQRSDKSLGDLALMFNSVVQGWINYYGRFYRPGPLLPPAAQRPPGPVGPPEIRQAAAGRERRAMELWPGAQGGLPAVRALAARRRS